MGGSSVQFWIPTPHGGGSAVQFWTPTPAAWAGGGPGGGGGQSKIFLHFEGIFEFPILF